MIQERQNAILKRVEQERCDGFLVSALPNVRYLSGFANNEPNVAYLLLTPSARIVITDYRFSEQAQQDCQHVTVYVRDRKKQTLGQTIAQLSEQYGIKRLAFEQDQLSYSVVETLQQETAPVVLQGCSNWVEQRRRVKDDDEVAAIKMAAQIGDRCFEQLLNFIQPGMCEIDVAVELEYRLMKAGAEGLAFPTILVSGKRTSMPHGTPSHKKIEKGDWVTVDFGAVVNGYRSDMTRTFVMGRASPAQRALYNAVLNAQINGINALRAGVAGHVPYQIVRNILERSEYSNYIGEGLGHCVGLSLHERPFLDATCNDILQENFVLTIEPGIYIPDWGGVRIEDDVWIRANDVEVLTQSPKHLIEV